MARYVLPVVGAVVGFYVGGASGAAWGWQLGAAAGSLVDPQVIKGPGIGDLVQQTSQAGVPRPIVFGRSQPIAGNVIATGKPIIVKREEGGKGGPKYETESVYRTYAVRICEGPIDGILRIWRNNILVYDARVESDLTPEENAKLLVNARFFLGAYDQMPSPDLETIFGVGLTPAHRGTCYMVMAGEDLTDFRGAIPQWQFQVARGTRRGILSNAVLHPWVTIAAADPRNEVGVYQYTVANNGRRELCDSTGPMGTTPGASFVLDDAINAVNWRWVNEAGGLLAYDSDPCAYSAGFESISGVYWDPSTAEDFPGLVTGSYQRYNWLHFATSFERPDIIGSGSGVGTNINNYVNSLVDIGESVFIANVFAAGFGEGANVWKRTDWGETIEAPYSFGSSYLPPNVAACTGAGSHQIGYATAIVRAEIWPAPPTPASQLVSGTFKVLQPYSQPGTAQTSEPEKFPRNPCLRDDDENYNSQAFWEAQYALAVLLGQMEAGQVYGVDYPTEQNWAYFYYDEIIETTIPLVDIVTELCERVGLTQFDVTELEGLNCWGLTVTNQYPVYAALQSLGQVFMFDGASIDGEVKFVRRGADAVATITLDDYVDDQELDFETTQRQDSIGVPRVIHLNYFDIDGGLATDKQSSERPGTRRSIGEQSLSIAVIMDSDQAAQVVSIQHKVGIEELRGERRFSLPDSFIRLTVADNVLLQWGDAFYRTRIATCEVMDGFQQYTGLHDRQSVYTSDVEGIPASPQTPPPSSVVGATLLEPLDIHILRDSDDAAGLIGYLAVSGYMPAWRGALVELSYDGGANYVESFSVNTSAVMGTISTALADHPQAYPDTINSVTVEIGTDDGVLEASDLTGMLNGANLAVVGDELIQFATVDEVSEGTWEVSYLLRGRKGTSTEAHEIGERFVLLNRNSLLMIPASLTDIGRTLTFRATSFGASVDAATIVSIVYAGISQTEREVSYLSALRDVDTLTVSWQGVGRLGSGAQVAHGQRFTGYRVTFSDGVNSDIVIETTQTTITQDVSSLDSPCTVSVEQINSLTGAGPSIEVIA